MHLVSFRLDGVTGWGIERDGDVFPASQASGEPTLRRALASGAWSKLDVKSPGNHRLADVELLPVIPDPPRILCIGMNYAAHVAELSRDPAPSDPTVFQRNRATLVAHGDSLVRPSASDNFDYEGELAVIVGAPGKHLTPDDALDHLAGYAIFNDASVRDYQQHSLFAGKNFDRTGALGPWMVTADECPRPFSGAITTRLNDRIVQEGHTDDMQRSVADILVYLSRITELQTGDVIATGTPSGVGWSRKPPLWMQPGDTIEVQIEHIGTLRNTVVAE